MRILLVSACPLVGVLQAIRSPSTPLATQTRAPLPARHTLCCHLCPLGPAHAQQCEGSVTALLCVCGSQLACCCSCRPPHLSPGPSGLPAALDVRHAQAASPLNLLASLPPASGRGGRGRAPAPGWRNPNREQARGTISQRERKSCRLLKPSPLSPFTSQTQRPLGIQPSYVDRIL